MQRADTESLPHASWTRVDPVLHSKLQLCLRLRLQLHPRRALQLQPHVFDIRVHVRLDDAQRALPAQPRRFREPLQILEQAVRLLRWRMVTGQPTQPTHCSKVTRA